MLSKPKLPNPRLKLPKSKLSARQHREIGEREEYQCQLRFVEKVLARVSGLEPNAAVLQYSSWEYQA